jgi:FixJ family two-component response regulator
MASPEPIVIIVDDDASFRRSAERLVRSAGFKVQGYADATSFLKSELPDTPACAVVDVRMPGLSGLDLQRELNNAGLEVPLIFVTGHGDIPMSVQAMKRGAVEFLTKPFRDHQLLEAIDEALERSRRRRDKQAKDRALQERYKLLTPRERQVMAGVVSGKLNKQIAAELGTTEKTIKFHRGHIMQKMQAASLADLVRKASRLEMPY